MFIPANLVILVAAAVILVAEKALASRRYYTDLSKQSKPKGWRYDPSRDYPEGH